MENGLRGWEELLNLIPIILFCTTVLGLAFRYIRGICALFAWPTYIGLREMSSMAPRWKWHFKIPKGGHRLFIMDIAASCCTLSSFSYLQKLLRSPARFSRDLLAHPDMLSRSDLVLVLLAMVILFSLSYLTPEEEARMPWPDRFKDIPTPKFWESVFKS